MLQRPTLTPTPANLPRPLRPTSLQDLVRILRQILWLPNTLGAFFAFLVILSVVTGSLLLHVYLSAQIMEIELEVQRLQGNYNEIQRQNAEIVWHISKAASLDEIQVRAKTLGFVVNDKPQYVHASLNNESMTDQVMPVIDLTSGSPVHIHEMVSTSSTHSFRLFMEKTHTWIQSWLGSQ